MGGSTNTVLHALAIAHEGGIEYPLERINAVADKVPTSVQGQPVRALAHGRCAPRRRHPRHPERSLSAATGLLHLDRMTVTGKNLGETVSGCRNQG